MLCLALAGALLEGERPRRLAAAGLLILGLALAAWHAGSPPGGAQSPSRLGRGFLIGNAGLLLLGIGLAGAAAWRASPDPARLGAWLLTALGVALLGPTALAFLGGAGPLRALGGALGLALTGAAAAAAGRALTAGPSSAVARRLAPPPLPTARPASRTLAGVVAAGAVAAALGPHLALIFGGLTVAAWSGYFAFHHAGTRPVPVAPALTLVLLPVYWLLAAVAGDLGLAVAGLPQVPLSPAADLLVAPTLLLAGWAVSGLWPLQRQLPGTLFAPLGALLIARAALPLSADALAYWRPMTVPLVLVGLGNAAAYARWPLVLAAAGFLGVAGGAAAHPRILSLIRSGSWLLGVWAGLRVLEAGLRGEVVYHALGALGLALIVAAGGPRAAGDPSSAR
jgi:hypothetical protein